MQPSQTAVSSLSRQNKLTIFTLQVVIVQPLDNGNKPHPFGHAVVAGMERYPAKITRRMSKARQEKRSKVKPFIKVINYNHLMPTRYTLELEGLKGAVTADTFKEVSQREDAKKTVKKVLEERYTSGKNRWFFTPLSMYTFISSSPAWFSLFCCCRDKSHDDLEESIWLTRDVYYRILNFYDMRFLHHG